MAKKPDTTTVWANLRFIGDRKIEIEAGDWSKDLPREDDGATLVINNAPHAFVLAMAIQARLVNDPSFEKETLDWYDTFVASFADEEEEPPTETKATHRLN
jgi:hypothetical protein